MVSSSRHKLYVGGNEVVSMLSRMAANSGAVMEAR